MARLATLVAWGVLAWWLVLDPAAKAQTNPEQADQIGALNRQAVELAQMGRYVEAVGMARQALALSEQLNGPDHPSVGKALVSLAELDRRLGRYDEAEALYRRATTILEKLPASGNVTLGTLYNNLAGLFETMGRYSEAEPLYLRSISVFQEALDPQHPNVGLLFNNLAELYKKQGRHIEAERHYKRALEIFENALGFDHANVGQTLDNLAGLYQVQGRESDAESLHKRAISILEAALGPDNPEVGIALSNLASLYNSQGRYAEAEPLYERDLAITELTVGPDHPSVAQALQRLAWLYENQGRYADAEPLCKRALAIVEASLRPDHPLLGEVLNTYGWLYSSQARYAEAKPLYERALEVRKRSLSADNPDVEQSLNNLAGLYFLQSDWKHAAEYWQQAADLVARRSKRGMETLSAGTTGLSQSDAQLKSHRFSGLVKVKYRMAATDKSDVGAEMFDVAQWARSSRAAASLAQMAARGAVADAKLAAGVRERQDLASEWQQRDTLRIAAVSQAPEKRDREAEDVNIARLGAIDARIAAIDTQIANGFPDYAALANPLPLSIADVQSRLRDDETLVLFLDTPEWKPTPEETFIWAVTKTESRWVHSDLGTPSLKQEVAALRCGLDGGGWSAKDPRCVELLDTTYTAADHKAGKPLPFDHARSHALYRTLFGEIEDLIKDKHLLIVPSGPLQQLPFQVLVTKLPQDGKEAKIAWLIRNHAITVLPSVSSLNALRGNPHQETRNRRPYLAFANPLLDGETGDADDQRRAGEAARKTDCATVEKLRQIEAAARDFAAWSGREVDLGGLADLNKLRKLPPVPQTADLSCDVARALGASEQDVKLGLQATETTVKAMNASETLTSYVVVSFATHGAVAGELGGSAAEPGLVLTPPSEASEADDGYLAASEVAGLKLNADWVILSACNTAAGGAKSSEALSGLARAFFYAGAHSLLVSHWSVQEKAAVALVTKALTSPELKTLGRAEAMRRAMLEMADSTDAATAHPGYWAPFVIVGEGSAGL